MSCGVRSSTIVPLSSDFSLQTQPHVFVYDVLSRQVPLQSVLQDGLDGACAGTSVQLRPELVARAAYKARNITQSDGRLLASALVPSASSASHVYRYYPGKHSWTPSTAPSTIVQYRASLAIIAQRARPSSVRSRPITVQPGMDPSELRSGAAL